MVVHGVVVHDQIQRKVVRRLLVTQPGTSDQEGGWTMPHDYERNGTTTLFTGSELLLGAVIGECRNETSPQHEVDDKRRRHDPLEPAERNQLRRPGVLKEPFDRHRGSRARRKGPTRIIHEQ
jgi:hypothetical protein